MGFLKSLKDMKEMVEAAPAMIDSANQLGAAAQAQGANMHGMSFPGGQAYVNAVNANEHGAPSAAALEPIAGVDLATYVKVVKGISAFGYDQERLPEVAAANGIAPHVWQQAQAGWGERIQADRALGSHFNSLYTAV